MTLRSCASCPSFLERPDQVLMPGIGRSIGTPMCARYGKPLAHPDASDQRNAVLQRKIAEDCPSFGNPRPQEGRLTKLEVVMPDMRARDRELIDKNKQLACSSCSMCQNYVNEVVVANELGWTAGLCRAKGKLLLSNKLGKEAENCEFRQFGTTASTTRDLQLLPEYDSAVTLPNDPIQQALKQATGGFIEPGEYSTDREVTEDEIAAGIKAWRKFTDPEDDQRFVMFPVYDSAFFDDEDRALIPKTGSDEHPELYVDHFGGMYGLGVAWLELDETPVFWGMAGVGKTELLRHAAWIMQLPFHRISITKSTEIDDIAGKMEYTPEKGTYFRYGRLPQAWQKPGVICLDEPNVAGDPAVWHFIRPLTDNSKQLVMDMNQNEIIERHTDAYMGMAMNPAWDIRNIGALEIADADANRLFHTYIDLPPEPLEREIIRARVALDGWELDNGQLNMIMKIAKDLRGLIADDQLPITWAIRPQIKVARALKWFAPETAYRRAVGDFLEPEALNILLDTVRAHLPDNDINNVF